MIVLAEDIWWERSRDVTSLPLSALLEVPECEDQDEFWDACEDALIARFNVMPEGFKYTILESGVQ